MDNENDHIIVDQKYLENELHLSAGFVARHAREMGCFARKPRKFFLKNVIECLQGMALQAKAKARSKNLSIEMKKITFDKLFDDLEKRQGSKKMFGEFQTGDFAQYYRESKKNK